MIVKVNGKDVKINDKEIEVLAKTLKISEEEAIQVWLEDNDYEVNEEVERLTKQAKDNKITATIHGAQKVRTKREVTRKEDPEKESIISKLADFLLNQDNLVNIRITNIGKIIEFESNSGESYKLDLVKRRAKKN